MNDPKTFGAKRTRAKTREGEDGSTRGLVVNRLGAVLAERQWTLMDLAEVTDLPYAKLRRIMRPNSNPPLDVAAALSRALEVPLERLFSLQDDHRRTRRPPF